MTKETLKPCPFCDETKVEVRKTAGMGYEVKCWQCGVVGPIGATDVDAADRWNTRTQPAQEPVAYRAKRWSATHWLYSDCNLWRDEKYEIQPLYLYPPHSEPVAWECEVFINDRLPGWEIQFRTTKPVESERLKIRRELYTSPPVQEPVAWHSEEREKGIHEAVEFMRMLKDDEALPSNIRASGAMLQARFEKLTGDEFVSVDYHLERERLLHRALKAAGMKSVDELNNPSPPDSEAVALLEALNQYAIRQPDTNYIDSPCYRKIKAFLATRGIE